MPEESAQPMNALGYDYGGRERFLAISDPTFITYLEDREAVGYGRMPHWGLLVNPPVLYFLFSNSDSATSCFEIFHSWIKASNGDGDAVEISFLEYDDGSYGVTTGPEVKRLIDRTIPEYLQHEVEPIVSVPQKMTRIPEQSGSYRWFKGAASTSPFIVIPGTGVDGPLEDLAFRKREVSFVRASEVPPNHSASVFSHGDPGARSTHHPPTPAPREILDRRKSQLKRFFPVTLERLRFSTQFKNIQDRLGAEESRDWELRQAVCNLTLRHRHPELYEREEEFAGGTSVIDFLLCHPETVEGQPLPDNLLSVEVVARQLLADRRDLLGYVSIHEDASETTDEDVEESLIRLGLLGQ